MGSNLMLSVRYGNDVPPKMVEILEHHARHAGLSLAALEVIGASLDYVESFILAAEDGRGADYARDLGLMPPLDNVGRARWQAAKLFS